MPGIIQRIIAAQPQTAMEVGTELAVWYTGRDRMTAKYLAVLLRDLGVETSEDLVTAAIRNAQAKHANDTLRKLEEEWRAERNV